MELLCFLVFSICLLFSLSRISSAADTITSSQSLSDGKSLVSSPGGIFELGFFSPGISKSRYLGIWYKNIPTPTYVWVANRQTPINGSTGNLIINSTGNLVLVNNNNNQTVWSANSSKQSQSQSPVLQLLDNGNLVLRDEKDANSENYLWQSFDNPSDTLLPGMKLGWDLRTGLNRRLTAWKSPDDPSPGDFIWEMELHEYPEPVMWKGSKEYFRSGPWNGVLLSGKPPNAVPALNYSFISNEDEVYMTIHMVNKSALGRMIMNQTTSPPYRQEWIWSEADRNWTIYASFPRDPCDNYGHCGGNGNCVLSSSSICQCLDRFSPRSLENWNLNEFSQGCERRKPLNCKNDGFAMYPGLKLPDTTHSWVDKSMNLKECRAKCLSNCSCSAYTNFDVRGGGSGCAIWFYDLVDIKQMPGGDQDIYIKISASELDDIKTSKSSGVKRKVAIIASVGLLVMGVIILGLVFYKRKRTLKAQGVGEDKILEGKMKNIREKNFDFECGNEDMELKTFNLATVSRATDNFSNSNLLGEGGFGPVYKGILKEGQDIAVKRLSKCSGQGIKEFMNEVILIAKLQHRNLVKLLGCCIEGDEKMLIYEYMPNKSLDYFIFDDTRSKLLGWDQRINIIGGIARGLLYLHQDSRLRIIHRDLKTSNVLLDKDMNPKISDFGTARAFGADQTEENTNRVVGTYGYMSPEYVVDGLFSIKSDVYSFGVMVLEIVSGKKNRGFNHPDHQLNLLGHSWTLWIEGRPLEVMDEVLDGSCPLPDVSRCIHIALLCVQHQPEDRPNMASVVLMLGGEGSLPAPKQPGFFTDRNPVEADSSSTKCESHSINDSVTLLEAR